MKYVKMLALAAVATGALMAFIGAGTASASTLCSTTVAPGKCPEAQKWGKVKLKFTIPSGSKADLVNTSNESVDSCTTSEVAGEITNTGSATETVTGPVTGLTWESCSFPTKTLKTAALEVHTLAGTSNGTVTSDGLFEVTINTVLFGSCVYGVKSGGSLGDLTEGNPAVFHANAVAEKLSGSAFACPTTSKWTATYTLTSPAGTTLSVD